MSKPGKPPDTIIVQFIGPNGEVTDSRVVEFDKTAPAAEHDHQSWTEAAAFDEFITAVRQRDGDRFRAASRAFTRLQCWDSVWLGLSRLPDVDDDFRRNFRSRIAESGFHFRKSVEDAAVMISAFRHLLPPYTGPGLHLYRGELTSKYEQGDIGFSWSTSIEVGRMFARRRISFDEEPGVLLEATAPVEAIIAAPDYPQSVSVGECEYIVDPRALKNVRVID